MNPKTLLITAPCRTPFSATPCGAGTACRCAGRAPRDPRFQFPIALAVEVPAGKITVYVSGAVPPVVDEKAPKTAPRPSATPRRRPSAS